MSHSIYSFSSSNRWMNCPACIRMSKGVPNSTSPAAELGTAAHELGEFCILYGFTTYDCIGMVFNGYEVDDHMARTVAIYVGHIKSLMIETGVKPLVEVKVVLSSLQRDDVYGTSDIVFVYIVGRKLYIVDYKNGRGAVEVQDNTQLICYALASLDTFDLWQSVDKIVTTIVQPNYAHVDGAIRSAEYTIAELLQWWHKVHAAITECDKPDSKPKAGNWCYWCPARANCRERMIMTLQDAYTDTVPVDQMTIEELIVVYREIGNITSHLDAIGKRILEHSRTGGSVTGHKLVNTRPRAAVNDEKALVQAAGDKSELLYEKKLVGVTKAKKILPIEVINKFYVKPKSSTTLVPLSDNRPAINVSRPSAIGGFGGV